MRLASGAVVLALALALGAAPASARKSCTKGGKTLAHNRYLRVYEVEGDASEDEVNLYACDRKSHRRSALARAYDDGYVSSEEFSRVRLARRFVAFRHSATDVSCKAACPPDYDPTSTEIAIFDSRKRTFRYVPTSDDQSALVLTIKGAVAWAEGSGSSTAIRASDSAGVRTLDSGAIDPGSLGVELTIVSWTKDGQEYFARLR